MSKNWWKAAGVRAIKTFAQALIACIGTGAALLEVNWSYALSVAAVSRYSVSTHIINRIARSRRRRKNLIINEGLNYGSRDNYKPVVDFL